MIFRTEQITPEEYMTLRTTAEWTEFPMEEAETCVRNARAPETAIKRSEPRDCFVTGGMPRFCPARASFRNIRGRGSAEN